MIRATLSVLVPVIIGFVFVSRFRREPTRSRLDLSVRLALGVGAGFGICSSLFFIWLLLFDTASGYLIFNLLVVVCLAGLWLYRYSARRAEPSMRTASNSKVSKVELLLAVCFVISFLSAIGAFIFMALKRPHGEWDAWASWNMRARFLYRGGEHWSSVFSKELWYSGADYPLLLPASVAGSWTLAGSDTPAVPALIALLFTFATVGVTVTLLGAVRGLKQGYLAGMAMMIAPSYILHGSSQYADIPLGYFMLATLALLHLHESRRDDRLLLLAGVMAGMAAWTKNEGLLFIVALIVARLAVALPAKRIKSGLRQVVVLAKGFAPFLVMILFLKLVLAEPNPILASQQGGTLTEKIADLSRYEAIYRSFAVKLAVFGGADRVGSIWLILGAYLALAGIRVAREESRAVVASILTFALVIAGYFVVYLATPFELGWHLDTTLHRLHLQLWPSFVFLVFLIARPLDKLALKKEDAGVNPEPVQQ